MLQLRAWRVLGLARRPRKRLPRQASSIPIEREYALRRFLVNREAKADVFVLHDTEELFAYGYNRMLPLFKYKWTDTSQKAHTTIASMTVDVTRWDMLRLPPVEPTKDVT